MVRVAIQIGRWALPTAALALLYLLLRGVVAAGDSMPPGKEPAPPGIVAPHGEPLAAKRADRPDAGAPAELNGDCRPVLLDRQRFGFVAVSPGWADGFAFSQVGAGWCVDFDLSAPAPEGIDRALVIRTPAGLNLDLEALGTIVDGNPGATWLVGNEPDSVWQDYVLPEEYARIYHDVYTFIKARDPASRVAPGGIIQPTPLRLQYLDLILSAYQEQYGHALPLDLWNIHNAILNEVSCDYDPGNCWGAGIPPGIDAPYGEIRSIDDNDNLAMFEEQIGDFRRWMADRGYGGYPLIITEYGILMPDDFGFDVARVNAFMSNTFQLLADLTDPVLGDPSDDHRMVQRWAWFSLDEPPWNPVTGEGFNGNLFDPESGTITAHGLHFADETNPFPPLAYVDLLAGASRVEPTTALASPTEAITRSLSLMIANTGTESAGPFAVSLDYQGQSQGGSLSLAVPGLAPRTSQWLVFTLGGLIADIYAVDIEVDAEHSVFEPTECNNTLHTTVIAPAARAFLTTARIRDRTAGCLRFPEGPASVAAVAARREPSATVGFAEFSLPRPASHPAQIVLDLRAGYPLTVWVSERDGNAIARLDPTTGEWLEFQIPTPYSRPWGIAIDSTGDVWFTETAADRIGKLNVDTGHIVEYPIAAGTREAGAKEAARHPAQDEEYFLPLIEKRHLRREPWDIAVADDGSAWFTEMSANRIGRLIEDAGTYTITEHIIPTPDSQPSGIAVRYIGSYLWVAFTESAAGKLGVFLSPINLFEEIAIPTSGSAPQDLVFASNGALWLSERLGNKIAQFRASTTQDWYEYPVSTPGSQPYGIAMEGISAVWFTEYTAGTLGRWTSPEAPPAEYALPDAASTPTSVAIDADGCAWYTAPGANRIGRLCLEGLLDGTALGGTFP